METRVSTRVSASGLTDVHTPIAKQAFENPFPTRTAGMPSAMPWAQLAPAVVSHAAPAVCRVSRSMARDAVVEISASRAQQAGFQSHD